MNTIFLKEFRGKRMSSTTIINPPIPELAETQRREKGESCLTAFEACRVLKEKLLPSLDNFLLLNPNVDPNDEFKRTNHKS